MRFPDDAPVTAAKKDALRARLARLGVDLARVEEQAVRAGGPGGQRVNKTSSGVRLAYALGTETLAVKWTRERSHALNRFLALRELADEVEVRVSPGTSERLRERERARKQKDRVRRRRDAAAPHGDADGAAPAAATEGDAAAPEARTGGDGAPSPAAQAPPGGRGPAPALDERARRADRVRAMLLAGAVGDALGAPVEFDALATIRARHGARGPDRYVEFADGHGAITDDTQMTLFTAEGMIRARTRSLLRGICHPPSVVRHAYRRWLWTQGDADAGAPYRGGSETWPDGWLARERVLHARRAPGGTCLSGLRDERLGSAEAPLNDSKGCGGVMRVAPVAVLEPEAAFGFGGEVAALTHGHPTGWIAAGALAHLLARVVRGASLREAALATAERVRREARGGETLRGMTRAVELADRGDVGPEGLETLGGGWVADEALSIGLCAALAASDLRDGLRLAVTHSGDSDSTGSIAGNLLGAATGTEALPADLVAALDARDVVARVADDLAAHFVLERPGIEASDADRYPGW